MAAVATHAAMVNPTTHHLRRRCASEMAPNTGIDSTTMTLATALATANVVLEAPRSSTSQTVKYNVATFIEKIVFAKSYSAQLQRSRAGARALTRASPARSYRTVSCA